MKDLYLIDGYNVIFSAPEIFPGGISDLENCRVRLIDLLQDFGAHNAVEIIVVFDGKSNSVKAVEKRISRFFRIVFTPARMTADSYIERESYKRREEYRSIYVVTSDGPEQNQVLGNGAYRIPAHEMLKTLAEDKKEQHVFISRHRQTQKRNELGGTLSGDARKRLEELRK